MCVGVVVLSVRVVRMIYVGRCNVMMKVWLKSDDGVSVLGGIDCFVGVFLVVVVVS